MPTPSKFKDRLLTSIGIISMLVFVIAIETIPIAQNWTYTACAVLAAGFALLVFRIIIRGSRIQKSVAPTNVQLQNSPPAIIEAHKNDV